jgi:hypothetical protein
MRPTLSSKTEYVQVERKVSNPVTTMESVTVNRPQVRAAERHCGRPLRSSVRQRARGSAPHCSLLNSPCLTAV